MCPRIHKKAHPNLRPWRAETQGFGHDESRRGVHSRWFAKPKPALGLRPDDECRATYASQRYFEAIKVDEYDDRVWDVTVKASPVSKNMFTRVVSRLPDGECIAPGRVDQSWQG